LVVRAIPMIRQRFQPSITRNSRRRSGAVVVGAGGATASAASSKSPIDRVEARRCPLSIRSAPGLDQGSQPRQHRRAAGAERELEQVTNLRRTRPAFCTRSAMRRSTESTETAPDRRRRFRVRKAESTDYPTCAVQATSYIVDEPRQCVARQTQSVTNQSSLINEERIGA